MRTNKRLSIIFVLLAATLLSASCTVKDKEESLENVLSVEALISKDAPTLRADQIAKMAREITVLIEGPGSSGSGVIIQKEGNKYLLATAWHVIRSAQQGEEITAKTSDGKLHELDIRDAIKIKDVDLAIIKFTSRNTYRSAVIGRNQNAETADNVYVSGYPLATEAVPNQLLRTFEGKVIANTNKFIPKGYQLLYTNTTLPGMSGGPVLDEKGGLAGIHGQAELDMVLTQNEDIAVKTGTNQAIPVSYLLINGNEQETKSSISSDSLANLYMLRAISARTQIIEDVRELTFEERKCMTPIPGTRTMRALAMDSIYYLDKAIEAKETSYAYYLRALYKANQFGLEGAWFFNKGYRAFDFKSTIEEDLNEALRLDSKNAAALSLLARSKTLNHSEREDIEKQMHKKMFPEMNDQDLINAMPRKDYWKKINSWKKVKILSEDIDNVVRESNPQFQLFDRAIEINPNRAETYYEYADRLYFAGRHKWRLDIINKGIKHNPHSSKLYKAKSIALSTLRLNGFEISLDDSIEAINTAIRIDPTKYQYYVSKGYLHEYNDEYRKAIESFRMAISTGGEKEPYIIRIAEIYKTRLRDEKKYLEVMQELRYLPSFFEKKDDSTVVRSNYCIDMRTRMSSKEKLKNI